MFSTKFLSKLTFLQNIVSNLISRYNPAVLHNLEKYVILNKAHYLTAIEKLEGDYLEFGVFTGSSFSHSIKCCKNLIKYNEELISSRFFGFDSFQGFGELKSSDLHPFYTDHNFETDYLRVKKRIEKISGKYYFQLVKGFFDETLSEGPSKYGITKARVIFVDSDTYTSANQALQFCGPIVQEGTIIILDDFFSYKGDQSLGVSGAFENFKKKFKLETRLIFTYGMGGTVQIISRIGSAVNN